MFGCSYSFYSCILTVSGGPINIENHECIQDYEYSSIILNLDPEGTRLRFDELGGKNGTIRSNQRISVQYFLERE